MTSETKPKHWRLVKGNLELATITPTEHDFPWIYGTIARTEHFVIVADYFRRDLEAVRRVDDGEESEADYDALDVSYEQLKADGVRLLAPEGEPVAEFLMHVDGDDAWFRYSDEPFDDEP